MKKTQAATLRLSAEEIRIRLLPSEWKRFQMEGFLRCLFELGGIQSLVLDLKLAEMSSYKFEDFTMKIQIAAKDLQEPARKKDPYWSFRTSTGISLYLEVDVFPEAKSHDL